jgi:hypothetical protein
MDQTMILPDSHSKILYKVAAAMAILIVIAGATDAITSMGASVQDNRIIQATDWFSLVQTSRFEAFTRLGLINMLTLSFGIPIYLAFNMAFRRVRSALAAMASILFFIGVAVYLSSNTSFALFALSQLYATASAVQKPLLEASGQALLAQGADLTSGTFVGLILPQIAGLLIAAAMLRGNVFGKWIGWVGLTGFSIMTIFLIVAAFLPAYYDTAIMLSAPGGLILMTYQILLAFRFISLGRISSGGGQ